MRSGVAGSVSRVVAGLERAGHRVDLMSYDDAHTVVRDQLRLSTLGFSIARRRLREIDVIHLHGPAPSVSDVVLGAAALRRSMPPVVYTHHFTVWTDARGSAPIWRAYDAITRRLARAAAVVVATTPSYQEHLRTHSAVRVECIGWAPNVVPPPGTSSRPVRSGPLRVLVVGQMRTYKGHRVAIEAIAGLAGVRLTLAGSGPLAQTLWRRAGEVPNVTMVAAPSDADVDDMDKLEPSSGAAPSETVAFAAVALVRPHFGDNDPHEWTGRNPFGFDVHGVDVSKYQRSIDWEAAKASGVSFAFIKATEGGDRVEPPHPRKIAADPTQQTRGGAIEDVVKRRVHKPSKTKAPTPLQLLLLSCLDNFTVQNETRPSCLWLKRSTVSNIN